MTLVQHSSRASSRAADVPKSSARRVEDNRVLSSRSRLWWATAQYVLLLGGFALVGLLLYYPAVGIAIMWNVLIPVAPALVTIAPGLWRNICPMATFSLLPRRFGLSMRKRMSWRLASWLGLISIIACFLIVPLRHICLNTNGPLTVVMLASAAAIAVGMGFIFEQRSGWCATLCPIHPVEKLYGAAPAVTLKNARCEVCDGCINPCPDTVPTMTPTLGARSPLQEESGNVLVGSFFGFVCGWFQVPDYYGPIGAEEITMAFLWPLGGALASYAVFLNLEQWVVTTEKGRKVLHRVFAAAAVSAYYWWRIPALTGFDPRSGTLIDLTTVLPPCFPFTSRTLTTAFFFWFLVARPMQDWKLKGGSWQKRPMFAIGHSKK